MTEQTQLETIPPQKKAPVLSGSRGLSFSNIDEMGRFCQAVVNSKQFGRNIDTPEVALILLQAGLELGLTPIWSLTNIFVVNGKPTVYGDALLGIVRAHKDFADIRERIDGEGENMVAICEVDRKGQTTVVGRFSVADAKRAALWKKPGPWSLYPQRMLQMRARSWACRDAFADALRGLGVSEEMRDIEPRPIQAREVERPKLILPGEAPATERPNKEGASDAGSEGVLEANPIGVSDEASRSEREPLSADAPEISEDRDPVTGEYLF